ncbi:hypothetical protein [Polynucleobacter sp. JS-Polo-80-F4]|uniref:hypothetical protein n=1 Tax=Polynucleobacter sp. JS-Polo-80-F4 TaxID=2576918 RepID=UPI001C0E6ABC|nr:hypothetical protein [Polynucleobacter sp. JS-Polo-80-F4]MBU3617330.1 hypothetical protein [Polynucleobacter sp. JS-Polo-80-F4]
MNIKKGLIRLFIVSTIFVGLVGYYNGASDGNATQTHFYSVMSNAVRQMDIPECQAIVAKNPPDITSLSGKGVEKCTDLAVVWNEARAYHVNNNRTGLVDILDIRNSYEEVWGNYTATRGLYNAISIIFGYWAILVAILLLFFIGRWIWRGFKSK